MNWIEKKLVDICEKIQDGTHFSPSISENGKYKYITSKNIRNGSLTLNSVDLISKDEHDTIYKRCDVRYGDVLITKDGASTGNVCLNTLGEEISLLSSVAFIRANNQVSKNDFIYQYICSPYGQRKIIVAIAGQAITRITLTKIKNFKFYFPSLEEQQKIAAFLSSVDTKIEQLSRKKALWERYKQGMMQKLFSQEIRFKDECGKDYPEWEEKRIKDVCEINPACRSLPNTFTYIDLESVYKGMLVKQNVISKANAPSRARRVLRKRDVLFQTVRPYQKNNYYFELNGDCVASTGYTQLRAKASARFLYHLLHVQQMVNRIIARCTGTSYPAINSSDLGTIRIFVPTEQEQQKIAAFLSSIDQKIELVEEQLKQAQIFKKGLLQQMFI